MNEQQRLEIIEEAYRLIDEASGLLIMANAGLVVTIMSTEAIDNVKQSGNVYKFPGV